MKQGLSLLLWGLLFWATAYAFGDARSGSQSLRLEAEGPSKPHLRDPG